MKRLSFLAALACAALLSTTVAAPAFALEPVKNDLSAAPAAVGLANANVTNDTDLVVDVSGANFNDDSGAIVALVQYRYGSNYNIGLTAAPPLIATAMTYDAGRSPRANLASVDGRSADSLYYAFGTLNAAALGIAASG